MSEIEPQFKRIKLLNPLKFSFGGFRWAQQSTEIGQSASGRFNSSGQTSSGHNSRTQWPSAIESRPTRSVHKSDADQCNAEHRQKYNPYHFWRNLSAYFWNATAATRKNCLVLQSDRPVEVSDLNQSRRLTFNFDQRLHFIRLLQMILKYM